MDNKLVLTDVIAYVRGKDGKYHDKISAGLVCSKEIAIAQHRHNMELGIECTILVMKNKSEVTVVGSALPLILDLMPIEMVVTTRETGETVFLPGAVRVEEVVYARQFEHPDLNEVCTLLTLKNGYDVRAKGKATDFLEMGKGE